MDDLAIVSPNRLSKAQIHLIDNRVVMHCQARTVIPTYRHFKERFCVNACCS